MRIVHVISSLDPARGGPPRVAACLAAAQADLGHEVRVLTTVDPGRQQDVDQMTQRMPGWSKVEVVHVPAPSLVQSLTARPTPRIMHHVLPWADGAHLHSLWVPILRVAAVAALQHRTPYVLTPHGTLDPWAMGQKKLKKRIALMLGYRNLLNRATFLHALNEDERRLIEPQQLRCPVVVVPNGVFMEEIDPLPPTDAFQRHRPQLHGRSYMLFLSRLHYKKGLDILAEAYAQFMKQGGGLDLVVAGPDGGARADFEQRIRRHQLSDRVHVVGSLYGQDKIEAMAGATAFVLPTRQEGFSVAIAEALACSVPVITTHDAHFPEVAGVGAGFVESLDPSAVSDAMKRIDSGRARAKQMGSAGRRLIMEKYTWRRIAEQMVDVYARAKAQGAKA